MIRREGLAIPRRGYDYQSPRNFLSAIRSSSSCSAHARKSSFFLGPSSSTSGSPQLLIQQPVLPGIRFPFVWGQYSALGRSRARSPTFEASGPHPAAKACLPVAVERSESKALLNDVSRRRCLCIPDPTSQGTTGMVEVSGFAPESSEWYSLSDTTVPSYRLGPALLVVFPTVNQRHVVGSTLSFQCVNPRFCYQAAVTRPCFPSVESSGLLLGSALSGGD